MKYQKRYKPKTKFEKFLKVYFIIGILVIVLTGVYASVKSMQRKKEVASETIIHGVRETKIVPFMGTGIKVLKYHIYGSRYQIVPFMGTGIKAINWM